MKATKNRPISGRQLTAELQAETPATPPSGEAFWSDFKARSQLYPQHAPQPVRLPYHFLRWGLAVACGLLVMAGAGVWRLTLPAQLSTINSFDVGVKHDAVLVMDDDKSESTLLWIVGMDVQENGDQQ